MTDLAKNPKSGKLTCDVRLGQVTCHADSQVVPTLVLQFQEKLWAGDFKGFQHLNFEFVAPLGFRSSRFKPQVSIGLP